MENWNRKHILAGARAHARERESKISPRQRLQKNPPLPELPAILPKRARENVMDGAPRALKKVENDSPLSLFFTVERESAFQSCELRMDGWRGSERCTKYPPTQKVLHPPGIAHTRDSVMILN